VGEGERAQERMMIVCCAASIDLAGAELLSQLNAFYQMGGSADDETTALKQTSNISRTKENDTAGASTSKTLCQIKSPPLQSIRLSTSSNYSGQLFKGKV